MYVRMYVCVCHAQVCPFALICTYLHLRARSGTHALIRALTMEVGNREERRFLTVENAEDSATGPPQCMCFAEANRARREREKVQKSWREYLQARCKLCSLSCSIQP